MCSVNIYNWNFHSSSYIYELYYYGKKGYAIYMNNYTPKLKEKFEDNNQLDKLFYLDRIKETANDVIDDDDNVKNNNDKNLKKKYIGSEDLCFSDSLLYNHEIPWGVAITAKDVIKYLNELYSKRTTSDGFDNCYSFINSMDELMKFMNGLNWEEYDIFTKECDPKTVFARRRLSSQVFC